MKILALLFIAFTLYASEEHIKVYAHTYMEQRITINGVTESPVCSLCNNTAYHIICIGTSCIKFCNDHKDKVDELLSGRIKIEDQDTLQALSKRD